MFSDSLSCLEPTSWAGASDRPEVIGWDISGKAGWLAGWCLMTYQASVHRLLGWKGWDNDRCCLGSPAAWWRMQQVARPGVPAGPGLSGPRTEELVSRSLRQAVLGTCPASWGSLAGLAQATLQVQGGVTGSGVSAQPTGRPWHPHPPAPQLFSGSSPPIQNVDHADDQRHGLLSQKCKCTLSTRTLHLFGGSCLPKGPLTEPPGPEVQRPLCFSSAGWSAWGGGGPEKLGPRGAR